MEDMVIDFFMHYGLTLTLIACSGIFVLGYLKWLNVFEYIEKTKRKYVYAAISSGFSIVAAAIYLSITATINASAFAIMAVLIYGINQTLYSCYENWGLRGTLKKLKELFLRLIFKEENDSETDKNPYNEVLE